MARYLDSRLKLRQLRIANALAEHGSISGASRALCLSQPAVTKALQELEKIVGSKIFERHPKGVEATVAGRGVIDSARRILVELIRLDEELDRIASGASKSVTVGATPGPAVGLLPQTLAFLRQNHPDLQVHLIEGSYENLAPPLGKGEIDVIVGRLYDPSTPDGFFRRELFDDPVRLFANVAHPLLGTKLTIQDVAAYDLIVPPVSRRYGQEVDQLLKRMPHFRPRLVRSLSLGFVREMVLATDMIALAPRLMMAAEVERGTICALPIELGFPPRPSGVTYRDNVPLSAGASLFIAGIEAIVGGIRP